MSRLLIDARLEFLLLQNLLGAEGTGLQWRLIASHLITRFSREPLAEKNDACGNASQHGVSSVRILGELFTVLGYFAANNSENQVSRSLNCGRRGYRCGHGFVTLFSYFINR